MSGGGGSGSDGGGGDMQVSGAEAAYSTEKGITTHADTQISDRSFSPGGGDGPELYLYRNSSSPAANDDIGIMNFLGKNDAGQDVVYANVKSIIKSVEDKLG